MKISFNGQSVKVSEGQTLASALMNAGVTDFAGGLPGRPRAPLCAMGICFECLVVVNGEKVRSCLVLVEEGMEVVAE